jgi:nucleotide-binding universal stress UspA family protein
VRDPALDQELLREARSYLDVLLGRIGAGDRARVNTALLLGDTVETLADRVRDEAVDLVVMTTHGRGGVSRAWLGSVADGVLRRSPAPILLLRPGEGAEGQREGGFPRVLVPLDGSATEDRMIEHAVAVAGTGQAEYILLRVLAADESPLRAVLPQRGETPSSRTQRATVEASLGSRAEALRARGLAAATHIVVHDSPARAILDYAAESDASLIAMATRSRGGLERALLGSVADKVLRGSDRPLLLWNPAESEAGGT